jgi:predicted NAD/FAD-binding protein
MASIAIVGTGISGLGAAYLLHREHDITVYEADARLGGHSRTVEASIDGLRLPVDTGFIVYNERNYPNLTGLFRELDVPTVQSDMSFGVSIQDGWLEYASSGLSGLFGQRSNLLRPKYWGMLRDILRFNRSAEPYVQKHPEASLGEMLDEIQLGDYFRHYYLLPMGGSIWSTSVESMSHFPALTFVQFFRNHGLLSVNDQPQWHTVKGGSREYVRRLSKPFTDRILKGHAVRSIQRDDSSIYVLDVHGHQRRFDYIILACHPDQAIRLLDQPTAEEDQVIGAFEYQPNEVYLHLDTSYMPKQQRCWASWIYRADRSGISGQNGRVSLSYWMNNLQELNTKTPVIVTLNPLKAIPEEHILDQHTFHHPVFNQAAIYAQSLIPLLNGKNRTYYCGAWQRYGFHEDGLWSAVRVADQFGVKPTW